MARVGRAIQSVLLLCALVAGGLPAWSQNTNLAGVAHVPGTIRIASFNIRIFSDGSRNDSELRKIVAVLAKYDLVAIQELRDVKVMERTRTMLNHGPGPDWRFEVSKPVGHTVKERYAFLYRSDRVLVQHPGRLVADPQGKFIREPYYATFRAGNFDFTLLTIHALYKSKNAPERQLEFEALADAFTKIQAADPDEQDLVLLGDFNDASTHPRFASVSNLPAMKFLIQQPAKTTVSNSSLYDNIGFQTNHVTEYTGAAGVDFFDAAFPSPTKASLEVSDHRPVWARFYTTLEDDD